MWGVNPVAGFSHTLAFGSGVNSFMGKIPVGNTGGANVLPLQPIEIPADLEALLKPYRN